MNVEENMLFGIDFMKIKQFLCKHEYERSDNEPLPIPLKGGCFIVSKLHKCKKCGKTRYFGSGWIC